MPANLKKNGGVAPPLEAHTSRNGRMHKSILNAEVSLLFYFLSLFFAFFSRKIFLSNLGDDFIGLTGTLSNILGYLNLAELGIGTSVSYFLYKPLQQNDHASINNILSVFGYLYRWIGILILGFGVLVSIIFPFIFKNESLGLGIVYFSFYSILGSCLIGYFINYRQILLSADQKNYLVAVYTQSAGIVKTILQIYFAYAYKNLFVWVSIEFLFGVVACIILNWKINKEYPWLACDKSKGRMLMKDYPEIWIKTKQVFVHKLKYFILGKSDELFIFAFVSLKMVTYYGNYMMIVSKVVTMFVLALNNVGASVGNLIAEGNKANTMKVFWELSAIRYFIAGIVCFSLFCLIEPFISLWLGAEYVLPRSTLMLLLSYFYINISQGAVDSFIYGYGIYGDTWSAWTELVINLTITLIAGYYMGINGILLGKIVSTFLITLLWKPYYLFLAGLKESYINYWKKTIRYHLIFVATALPVYLFLNHLPVIAGSSYLAWGFGSLISVVTYCALNIPLYLLFAPGSKDLLRRVNLRKILSRVSIIK